MRLSPLSRAPPCRCTPYPHLSAITSACAAAAADASVSCSLGPGSYRSYLAHGFPRDELAPLSCHGFDTWGGYALTLVDALDTLALMGYDDEFEKAIGMVLEHVRFEQDTNVSGTYARASQLPARPAAAPAAAATACWVRS